MRLWFRFLRYLQLVFWRRPCFVYSTLLGYSLWFSLTHVTLRQLLFCSAAALKIASACFGSTSNLWKLTEKKAPRSGWATDDAAASAAHLAQRRETQGWKCSVWARRRCRLGRKKAMLNMPHLFLRLFITDLTENVGSHYEKPLEFRMHTYTGLPVLVPAIIFSIMLQITLKSQSFCLLLQLSCARYELLHRVIKDQSMSFKKCWFYKLYHKTCFCTNPYFTLTPRQTCLILFPDITQVYFRIQTPKEIQVRGHFSFYKSESLFSWSGFFQVAISNSTALELAPSANGIRNGDGPSLVDVLRHEFLTASVSEDGKAEVMNTDSKTEKERNCFSLKVFRVSSEDDKEIGMQISF